MTYLKDKIEFASLSSLDHQAKSCLGEASVLWGGISIQGTQGAQSGYRLNVTSASADNCAQVLQRLITMLFEKKSV